MIFYTAVPKCFRMFIRNMSVIPKRLEGKVAVVTGSSHGIGLAVSRRLALEGAKVVISGRKQYRVTEVLRDFEREDVVIIGTACHVGKASQRLRMLEMANYALGGIDILVINAGTSPELHEVLDTPERTWDKVFHVNVKSAYRLAKETVTYMKKRGKGKIIINSSISAYTASPKVGAYCVSKTALLGLTKNAALQLAKDNINVNAIAPGLLETKFSNAFRKSNVGQRLLKQVPLKRWGRPEEIAGVVAYLASEDADYVTGEIICVGGGAPSRL